MWWITATVQVHLLRFYRKKSILVGGQGRTADASFQPLKWTRSARYNEACFRLFLVFVCAAKSFVCVVPPVVST